MFSTCQVVLHCDWLIILKCSAVDGRGISPDNWSELAIHVVIVTSTVVLSLAARLMVTSPSPSLNLLATEIYVEHWCTGNRWYLTVGTLQEPDC